MNEHRRSPPAPAPGSSARLELAIDRQAAVERVALDATSWVDVVRGFVREPAAVLHHLLADFVWRESLVWRYEKYITEPRLGAHISEDALPTALRQAGLHLDSTYRRRFTGPAMIRYRNGHDAVGVHRDREMRWLDDTLIGIVVLGEPRPFVLRPLDTPRGDSSSDLDLAPGNGDLIVRGGRAQADWLHGVPPVQHATERISATWRWTSRTGPADTSASYNAPRNFGDSGRAGPQRRRT